MIISNKRGIKKLSHELPNDLKLRNLENIKKICKFKKLVEL